MPLVIGLILTTAAINVKAQEGCPGSEAINTQDVQDCASQLGQGGCSGGNCAFLEANLPVYCDSDGTPCVECDSTNIPSTMLTTAYYSGTCGEVEYPYSTCFCCCSGTMVGQPAISTTTSINVTDPCLNCGNDDYALLNSPDKQTKHGVISLLLASALFVGGLIWA